MPPRRTVPVMILPYSEPVAPNTRSNARKAMFFFCFVGRSSNPHNAGLNVMALIVLRTVAAEIVKANWRYIRPDIPPRNAVGTNTASSVSVVAMHGPITSPMDAIAASRGLWPMSIWRWVFSTTTIESSTTTPIASTNPNSVRVLTENPSIPITANVPTSETGMQMVGISDARQSCRKTKTISTTNPTAWKSVL